MINQEMCFPQEFEKIKDCCLTGQIIRITALFLKKFLFKRISCPINYTTNYHTFLNDQQLTVSHAILLLYIFFLGSNFLLKLMQIIFYSQMQKIEE